MSESPYRVQPPRPPDPYLEAWSDLRMWHYAAWVAFVAWFGAGAVCFVQGLAKYVLLPLAAVVVIAEFRVARFRCPQCEQFMGRNSRRWGRLQRQCVNCGIAIDTPKDARPVDVP